MNGMKASLTLTLDDKLSAGLKPMKDRLENIKQIGKDLSLGKLENAAKPLERANAELRTMSTELRTVSREIGATQSRFSRLAQSVRGMGSGIGQGIFGKHGMPNAQQRGGMVGAGEALAGGIALGMPIKSFADMEDGLRKIAIMKHLSGPALNAEVARLRKFLSHEALATGQTTLVGAETYYDLRKAGTPERDVEDILALHHRAATAFYTDPKDFTRVTAALNNMFKVPHDQMAQALSAVGLAANLGMMSVPDIGATFPKIAGLVTGAGMTGRGNANMLLAMMQTQMTTSGDVGTAFAQVYDGINSLWKNATENNFAGSRHGNPELKADRHALLSRALGGNGDGINLLRWRKNVEAAGLNPIEAMLDKLESLRSKGKFSPSEMTGVLNTLFHEQQEREFWQTQLRFREKRRGLQTEFDNVSPDEAARMFKSRYDGPAVTLKRIEESGAQIERRAGEGFSALLKPLDNALQGTIGWIEKLDEGHKGLADAVLLVTGSMAGLGAALAAIGFLAPAITSGAGLLGGALLPAAGAATLLGIPAAVGYSIYRDWGNGTNYSDPSFQPEFGIPLMNQDDWDSRHPPTPHEAGHMVRSPRQSGIGSHWDWQPANSGATNGTLEINIHTDPGTQAEVKNAPEGVMINQRTDPGQTLGRP